MIDSLSHAPCDWQGHSRTQASVFHRRLAFAATLLVFAAVGAHAQSQPRNQLSGSLSIIGTDTMKDLLARWIQGFCAIHPAVHIQLTAKGALTAAPALTQGSAGLAPLGREFTPSETANFHKQKGYDPSSVRVALGSYDISGKTVALGFFVNAQNPVSRLDFHQLAGIYCTSVDGKSTEPVTRWGQLGLPGEWTSREIHLIGVNFPDGISNFIRLRVCKGGEFRTGIHEEHTGGAVNVLDRIVSDVTRDPAAIGYAGFANLKPGSRLVPISESEAGPYLQGTRNEVAAAQYPLTRYIYIFFDRHPNEPVPPLETAFLHYVLSPTGQALVGTDNIYMPLPAPIAKSQQSQLQ